MEVQEAIRGRRSVRKFSSEPVSDEELGAILEAARWAPSWANTQCWEIVVVRDGATKKALSELLVPERNPAKQAVAEAPVVLAVCGRKGVSGFYKGVPVTDKGDWLMFDVALAVQNMALMAHALGLGTVIVGALDHARAGELLGLPDDVELVVLMPIGRPAHEPKAPPRKPLSEFVHLERYGRMWQG